MEYQILFVFQMFVIYYVAAAPDKCLYQMDMGSNKMKITCEKGAVLYIVDQHGNPLLSGETTAHDQVPIVLTLNRSNIATLKDETHKATKKLNDASKLLRKVREDLTDSLNNPDELSKTLQMGDAQLTDDIEQLRKHGFESSLAWESMIAAVQNQYKYLQMGLLLQNRQLNDLIKMSMRLTTSIIKTARGSRSVGEVLDLRTDLLNETVYNITKLMPGGWECGTFFGTDTVFCPQTLQSISPKGIRIVTGVDQGTVMRDPYSDKFWVTYGYNNVDEVVEYNSIRGLKLTFVDKKYTLPFACVGTGHAVYKKTIYCQKIFTNKIEKYSLAERRWLGERALDHVGVLNTFPYQSKRFSDVDFAVDEMGLWLIYATNTSQGNIVISKINDQDDNMEFENTWVTEIPKTEVGNAFIICGILYATASYDTMPTYIKYMYDTNKWKGRELQPDELPFVNSVTGDLSRVYSLDYSPGDVALFSWNIGRIEIFPVSFLNKNEP